MVGIVVVNYNSGDEIVRLLESVFSQSIKEFSVVVVDNASPDGSGKELSNKLKTADVVLSEINGGFAFGVNLGIKYLQKKFPSIDYFWILNPDMKLNSAALEALLDRAMARDAVVGSKVLYPRGDSEPGKIWSAGGLVDFNKEETVMRGNGEEDKGQFDTSCLCDYVPGCSLFFSSNILNKVGFFPEEYFLYFEETDWCLRAKKSGFSIVYEPKSVVTHYFREEKLSEPLVTYYYNRNRRLFFSRYLSWAKRLRLIYRTIFYDLPNARKSLTESPDERYRELFNSHVDSCLDFVFFRFGKKRVRDGKG